MLSISPDLGLQPREPMWVPQPRIAPAAVHHRADALERPAHPADVAQARMFDAIMRGEIAELEEVAASMEKRVCRVNWCVSRRRRRVLSSLIAMASSMKK